MSNTVGHDQKQRLYPNTVRVLNRIVVGPTTVGRLAQELHLSVSRVEAIVEFLHELGVIHVRQYTRASRGKPSRVWAAGAGEDAVRIAPLTDAEKAAAYRARGGDTHGARTLQRNARRIEGGMTLAGLLGVRT